MDGLQHALRNLRAFAGQLQREVGRRGVSAVRSGG
jgi:hypothetical protein